MLLQSELTSSGNLMSTGTLKKSNSNEGRKRSSGCQLDLFKQTNNDTSIFTQYVRVIVHSDSGSEGYSI